MVDDLIISPDRNVSYVIVGAGGFIGIARHDVAVPVSQIQDQGGKLVMAGGTRDNIKAMPAFTYAAAPAGRDRFVAAAERDIALGRAKLAELETNAVTATADAKTRVGLEVMALKADLATAERRLGDMKQATAARWKEFEADVSAATARLRKSVQTAIG